MGVLYIDNHLFAILRYDACSLVGAALSFLFTTTWIVAYCLSSSGHKTWTENRLFLSIKQIPSAHRRPSGDSSVSANGSLSETFSSLVVLSHMHLKMAPSPSTTHPTSRSPRRRQSHKTKNSPSRYNFSRLTPKMPRRHCRGL